MGKIVKKSGKIGPTHYELHETFVLSINLHQKYINSTNFDQYVSNHKLNVLKQHTNFKQKSNFFLDYFYVYFSFICCVTNCDGHQSNGLQ